MEGLYALQVLADGFGGAGLFQDKGTENSDISSGHIQLFAIPVNVYLATEVF